MHSSLARHASAGILLAVFTACAAPPIPPPTTDASLAKQPGKETAVFAGGCFWGVQSVFQRVKGVIATTAGYAGGSADTATYDQVTTETTGHAESVEVVYDPSRITYGQLLRIYFSVAHDPTQLNRQGPDVGTSYRSAIFYTNPEQERLAKAYIAQLDGQKVFPKPHRDAGHAAQGLLSRRGLSSGLRLLQSQQPVHRGLRPPQNSRPQGAVSRAVCRLQAGEEELTATWRRDKTRARPYPSGSR
jgi:peptide-methionine (S)-S-oxide reductase